MPFQSFLHVSSSARGFRGRPRRSESGQVPVYDQALYQASASGDLELETAAEQRKPLMIVTIVNSRSLRCEINMFELFNSSAEGVEKSVETKQEKQYE
ncbi:hypothetical protein F2P81_018041 [Scophthalmus maximus]|uniref:Uncharacterized protein n=1 Tax=Scophthalmus maximus TaxID=52904 RepID=A0A6A4S144_SCOMX|nr:hypothetical protein F2P81_018041 [Scophthalmus maximus]